MMLRFVKLEQQSWSAEHLINLGFTSIALPESCHPLIHTCGDFHEFRRWYMKSARISTTWACALRQPVIEIREFSVNLLHMQPTQRLKKQRVTWLQNCLAEDWRLVGSKRGDFCSANYFSVFWSRHKIPNELCGSLDGCCVEDILQHP